MSVKVWIWDWRRAFVCSCSRKVCNSRYSEGWYQCVPSGRRERRRAGATDASRLVKLLEALLGGLLGRHVALVSEFVVRVNGAESEGLTRFACRVGKLVTCRLCPPQTAPSC